MTKLTSDQISKNMKANKSSGTKPELLLAKTLWKMGLRYRKNDKRVFGKPDLTFFKHKIAIFVDGEFWHGKDWNIHKYDIKSNKEFWITKIERNMARDNEVNKKLKESGWTVLRFWGKDIQKHLILYTKMIEKVIYEKKIHENRK
ncbi:very short patch repair endonuclease [Testudinibacter sp. P80/BLE/0925]|uniref:very short patch repair endonuclease n=1 Tax=Testudinibacter sp. TW-1 TaxID=3417757 RepID=UPI003D3700EF